MCVSYKVDIWQVHQQTEAYLKIQQTLRYRHSFDKCECDIFFVLLAQF